MTFNTANLLLLINKLGYFQKTVYFILSGYSKDLAISHYLPHQATTSLHVNKMRKLCYTLCEKMNTEKTNTFLDLVKKDITQKGLTFSSNCNYLELYFLEMEIHQYITRTNLTNIKKIFKIMDQEDMYSLIEDDMMERTENLSKPVVSNICDRNQNA